MKRRTFLGDAAAAAALLACFPAGLAGVEREKTRGKIERRALGKTGRKLSVVGFGGLVLKNSTPDQPQIQLGADEHYAPVCWAHYDEATRHLAAEKSGAVLRPS